MPNEYDCQACFTFCSSHYPISQFLSITRPKYVIFGFFLFRWLNHSPFCQTNILPNPNSISDACNSFYLFDYFISFVNLFISDWTLEEHRRIFGIANLFQFTTNLLHNAIRISYQVGKSIVFKESVRKNESIQDYTVS